MRTLSALAALLTMPSMAVAHCPAGQEAVYISDSGLRITFEPGQTPTAHFPDGSVQHFKSFGNGTEVRALTAFAIDKAAEPRRVETWVNGEKVVSTYPADDKSVKPVHFWFENTEDTDPDNDILVWGDGRLTAACE